MIYMGDTPIPLEAIDALIERKTAPPAPPALPRAMSRRAGEGQKAAQAPQARRPKAAKEPAEKLEKAARIPPAHALALSIDRPKALRARAALVRAISADPRAKASHDIAAQVERRSKRPSAIPRSRPARSPTRSICGFCWA
jgi:hypothetical protein